MRSSCPSIWIEECTVQHTKLQPVPLSGKCVLQGWSDSARSEVCEISFSFTIFYARPSAPTVQSSCAAIEKLHVMYSLKLRRCCAGTVCSKMSRAHKWWNSLSRSSSTLFSSLFLSNVLLHQFTCSTVHSCPAWWRGNFSRSPRPVALWWKC